MVCVLWEHTLLDKTNTYSRIVSDNLTRQVVGYVLEFDQRLALHHHRCLSRVALGTFEQQGWGHSLGVACDTVPGVWDGWFWNMQPAMSFPRGMARYTVKRVVYMPSHGSHVLETRMAQVVAVE